MCSTPQPQHVADSMARMAQETALVAAAAEIGLDCSCTLPAPFPCSPSPWDLAASTWSFWSTRSGARTMAKPLGTSRDFATAFKHFQLDNRVGGGWEGSPGSSFPQRLPATLFGRSERSYATQAMPLTRGGCPPAAAAAPPRPSPTSRAADHLRCRSWC